MHYKQTRISYSILFVLFLCLTNRPFKSFGASAESYHTFRQEEKVRTYINGKEVGSHTTECTYAASIKACLEDCTNNKTRELLSQALSTGNGRTKATTEIIKELPKLMETIPDILHHAAETGDVHLSKLLIQAGAALDARNDAGLTPLHVAAAHGQTDAARILIDAGAEINSQSFCSGTPLHVAAHNGQSPTVRFLLSAGAHRDAPDRDKRTPLHVAAAGGHTGTAKILLDAGTDANASSFCTGTPLHAAVRNGHIKTVHMLVANGAQIDSLVPSIKQTALHLATETKRIEIALYLISSDADVNTPDDMALQTPLHIAASSCHMPLVRALTRNGAEVNAQDRHKRTPCHAAALSGKPAAQDVIRFLVSAGVDFDMRDNRGKTPLEYLASREQYHSTPQSCIRLGQRH